MNCNICLEPYNSTERNPKFLPCGHTYCLKCLQTVSRKECPLDKKVFCESPDALVTNFQLLSVSTESVPLMWCRDCSKEASADCIADHTLRNLAKVRSETLKPFLARAQAMEKELADRLLIVERVYEKIHSIRQRMITASAELKQSQGALKAALNTPTSSFEKTKQTTKKAMQKAKSSLGWELPTLPEIPKHAHFWFQYKLGNFSKEWSGQTFTKPTETQATVSTSSTSLSGPVVSSLPNAGAMIKEPDTIAKTTSSASPSLASFSTDTKALPTSFSFGSSTTKAGCIKLSFSEATEILPVSQATVTTSSTSLSGPVVSSLPNAGAMIKEPDTIAKTTSSASPSLASFSTDTKDLSTSQYIASPLGTTPRVSNTILISQSTPPSLGTISPTTLAARPTSQPATSGVKDILNSRHPSVSAYVAPRTDFYSITSDVDTNT